MPIRRAELPRCARCGDGYQPWFGEVCCPVCEARHRAMCHAKGRPETSLDGYYTGLRARRVGR